MSIEMHGTTILAVRRGAHVVLAGDGQVSLERTVVKGNARKLRRLAEDRVIAGFAGATADAFTLFDRFEEKLKEYAHNLTRASVELARAWRTDKFLRHLNAMLLVADRERTLILTGTGDVVEPEHGAAASTRCPRRGRCSRPPTCRRGRSPSGRCGSPPRSACTRTIA